MRSQPPIGLRAPLEFTASYSADEFAILRTGLQSRDMDEKWNVAFDEPWLHLYRSWTGFCIFGLCLQQSETGVDVIESWVNRDASQYGGTSVEHDRAVAKYVVETMMLRKYGELPDPPGQQLQGLAKAAYEHSAVGHIASEATRKFFRERNNDDLTAAAGHKGPIQAGSPKPEA